MRSSGNFSPEWGYLAPAPSFARTARVVLVATVIGATAGAGVVLSLVERSSGPDKTPVATRAIVTTVRAEAVPSVAPAAPVATASPVKPASASVSVAPAPADKPDISKRASRATQQARPAPIPRTITAAPSPAASVSANISSPNTAAPAPAAEPAVNAIAPASAAATADVVAPLAAPVTASAPAAASTSAATGLPAAAEPPKAVDAASADAPESTAIMAPEQAAPKKTKRHASPNKNASLPGIGSIFRRVFASHGGRTYYPNSADRLQ